jgi:hypothetical protein
MMPIMTSGLSALPRNEVDAGSTFNTLTQRVAAALGLAALTALATAHQAQTMADRAALLPDSGITIDPRIIAMRHNGPAGLIPLWQQLQLQAQAQAYSDVFLVVGCLTVLALPLAFCLRPGPDHRRSPDRVASGAGGTPPRVPVARRPLETVDGNHPRPRGHSPEPGVPAVGPVGAPTGR